MSPVGFALFANAVLAAAPAPTPENVQAAVQRSLPFIEAGGTVWMRERKCNSCHNVTFMVWSHNEAAAHGLTVDRKKLADWTKWALADSLSDRHWFKLRPRALDALKADDTPAALLTKLKPLVNKSYLSKPDFVTAVDKAAGDDAKAHHDRLVKHAALPNNGGGPDTLAQLLLGRAGLPEDPATAGSYAAVRSLLLEWQEPSGSWEAQGQLPGLKWGKKEMDDATTLWSLLAVAAGEPDEKLATVRKRALESLKKSTPGVTLQSVALHAVAAHRYGDADWAAALRNDLFARQNADGGWAWVKKNPGSDAFATGQALYALAELGRDGSDPSVRRGWEYLLRTQGADGGWDVPQEAVNTRVRGLNVYPHWGTAWAAIGLLRTLPTPAP